MIYFTVILHSKQKTLPRSFTEVAQSLKPTQCSCVLAGCMILMFYKFLNSQCFNHTRRCPKNWPPLYTFKSSTGGSQTMQPFSCCIIEQITLKTSKKCINNFVLDCSFLSSKDGVRCHATPLLVFSHFLAVCCNCMILWIGKNIFQIAEIVLKTYFSSWYILFNHLITLIRFEWHFNNLSHLQWPLGRGQITKCISASRILELESRKSEMCPQTIKVS